LSTNPEAIKKKLQALFEDSYGDYLDTVEGNHSDDEITLDDFAQIIYGDISSVQQVKSWPALAILSNTSTIAVRGEGGVWNIWNTDIELRLFFRHQEVTELAKIVDRHLEALMTFLGDYDTLEGTILGIQGVSFTPTETILPPGSTMFAKGLQVLIRTQHKG